MPPSLRERFKFSQNDCETGAVPLDPRALEQARADLGVVTSRSNAGGVQAVQWSLPQLSGLAASRRPASPSKPCLSGRASDVTLKEANRCVGVQAFSPIGSAHLDLGPFQFERSASAAGSK